MSTLLDFLLANVALLFSWTSTAEVLANIGTLQAYLNSSTVRGRCWVFGRAVVTYLIRRHARTHARTAITLRADRPLMRPYRCWCVCVCVVRVCVPVVRACDPDAHSPSSSSSSSSSSLLLLLLSARR